MFSTNGYLRFPIHALPPLMLGLAAAMIVVSAVSGLGIALIRGVAAVYLVTGTRMPPPLKRWHRALTRVRRHIHSGEWRDTD